MVKDKTGQVFGRLTVVSYAGVNNTRHSQWLCKCECGNTITVPSNNLISGTTQSCGCLRKERLENAIKIKRYGDTPLEKDRIYRIWRNMRSRTKYKCKGISKCYSERDIRVCDEWEKSFDTFRKWALNNGYNDNLSIDRIDNEKGYSPDNCRWATLKEQANNKRTNSYITYKGETHTIAEWASILGMSYYKLYQRLKRQKLDVEKAFTL